MNEHEVFIIAGADEIYLGTVQEINEYEAGIVATDYEGGIGISVAAVISDLVSAIAFNGGPRTFSIELREPGDVK